MRLSGDVGNLSVSDLIEFLTLRGRSATLLVTSGDSVVELRFHGGRIQSASGSQSIRLGQLLVDRGLLTREQLVEALALQQMPQECWQPLGKLLVDLETITEEQLEGTVRDQVARAVREAASWQHGRFHFEEAGAGAPGTEEGELAARARERERHLLGYSGSVRAA